MSDTSLQEFWIFDSWFEHDEIGRNVTLDAGNRSVLVNGKRHSSLFEQPVVATVAQNVRRKAHGDVLLLYHRGSRVVLISARIRSALEAINATGFELLPAVVRLGEARGFVEVPYSQLLINGWGGVAPTESGVVKVEHERLGLWRYSDPTDCSKIVDPNQYDGSDFFRVWPMPGSIFVTSRIKRLFEEMQVKNCRFESLEKRFGLPKLTLPGMAPAPLSLYLRPDRAKDVGGQFGIDWFDC